MKKLITKLLVLSLLAGSLAACSNPMPAGSTAADTGSITESEIDTSVFSDKADVMPAASSADSSSGSAQNSDSTSARSAQNSDSSSAGSVPNSDSSSAGSASPSSATSQDGKVASSDEMTEVVDVVEPGMVPIHADELNDGIYPITMKSSSSMFKADHVELVVENGSMYARLYMSSQSYLYMYAGTAAEASAADESQLISLSRTDDKGEELEAFTLPVESLDAGLPFASYSKRKEKWYDRTLLFSADSLSPEAFKEARYTSVEDLKLADGEYDIPVTLEGGSGKASVMSPARLTIKDGRCTVRLVWSSSNYDFMMVNGEKYTAVNDGGNSAFDIPVVGFDFKMPVQADTTAMSQPHLIDYTLYFESAAIKPAN